MSARATIGVGLAIGLGIALFGSMALGMMGGYGPGYMGSYGPGPGYMGSYGPGPGYGPCMMGGGCGGYGYGPGMMGGYGYGPGMMGLRRLRNDVRTRLWSGHDGSRMVRRPRQWSGGAGEAAKVNLNLSTDDVKNYLERWIVAQGNPRLKVGDVKEKDADSIEADIVTKEGNALVQRFTVNRHTGFYQPSGN